VQDNLCGTKHAYYFACKEIGITWTGSHHIDFALHSRRLHWMPSRTGLSRRLLLRRQFEQTISR